MRKTKILFAVLIIIFFAIIVSGQYLRETNARVLEKYPLYQSLSSVTYLDQLIIDKLSYSTPLNPNKYANCSFVKPKNRTIILRMDDLGAWNYDDVVEKITAEVLARNLSISEGVIPNDIERDRRFITWSRKMRDNPNVEFALHGYYHTPDEFNKLNYDESKYYLEKGKAQMIDHMLVVPVTFIPPYNIQSFETHRALIDTGFKIDSGGNYDISFNETIAYLGYTARTFDYDKNEYVNSSTTIQDCKESLDTIGMCIVMLHPQDYLEPKILGTQIRNLDESRYSDFISLLDGLQQLNADFKTYKDLLVCPK